MASIKDTLAAEAEQAEQAEGTQLRDSTEVSVTRGHGRTRTLQVRLNDDEATWLEAEAARRGIPVSTLARAILLADREPAGDVAAALDRLEAELRALRGKLTVA